MGKLIVKMLVLLAIVVGMSNYALYLMTGQSPFAGDGPDLSIGLPSASSVLPAGKEQAYKWRDKDGVVHYSSEPPPDSESAELLQVDPNTNLVQGLRPSESQEAETAETTPQAALPQGTVYNPENIRKLIDDAKKVQETLNERNAELEKY